MNAPAPGTSVRVEAPAKVNLLLRILERMPDGFHRLETLFQAVGFYDRLTIRVVTGGGVELAVRGGDVGPVEDNLVTRAISRFREHTGATCGLHVILEKGIPAGAGLGGGSSDAGAALRALNLLHGRVLDSGELVSLGGELGADVAFFSGTAGLALGEGRGHRLTPLEPLPARTLVLGLPPVHVATGPAYGALARARREAGGSVPSRALETVPRSWQEVEDRAVNDFQPLVPDRHPPVKRALEALAEAGGSTVLLSGSGGAVFGLFPEPVQGPDVVAELRRRHPGTRWEAVPTLEELPPPVRVEPDGPFH